MSTIRKSSAAKPQQKVILVQKQPAKAIRIDSDDDDDDYLERSAEKMVSFSEEDEVVLIAARKTQPKPKTTAATVATNSIRHRLGNCVFEISVRVLTIFSSSLGYTPKPSTNDQLHRTRKTVSLKASASPIVRKTSHLKSDGLLRSSSRSTTAPVSVKSRLSMNRKISYAVGPPLNSGKASTTNKSRDTVSSVFQRLGFND